MPQASEYERSQFTYCRAWGHTWYPSDSDWVPEFFTDFVVLRCERCGTERREAYGLMTGEVTLRDYVYPDGYQYTRGEDVPTRGDFRLMAIAERRRQRAAATERNH